MNRLVVKNFGVLKDIDIELNKTNLFIGDNGSGKSVLAKLITIVTSNPNYSYDLLNEFDKFDINFINKNTIIKYIENNNELISIEGKKISFHQRVLDDIKVSEQRKDLLDSFENPDNIDLDERVTRNFISEYIPAQRNLISLLNKSIYSLLASDIPLPKDLLKFASKYEKAKNEIKELSLLDMTYKNDNGEDNIYYNENEFLPLEHSSSGIQTALPMYLTLKYFKKKYNVIIEEPEQNLYPKAQIDTIKYIIENTSNNLYLMTHSPYVLSILNILLFAYKAANTNEKLKNEIEKIIPEVQQINPDEFSAYMIENGIAKDIKSKRGLISENSIDETSDTIDDNFNELMDIYREFKND